MKKLNQLSKIVSSFISDMRCKPFHHIQICQYKRNIKKLQNLNIKTNPNEKPKPNKYTKTGFYKNTLK